MSLVWPVSSFTAAPTSWLQVAALFKLHASFLSLPLKFCSFYQAMGSVCLQKIHMADQSSHALKSIVSRVCGCRGACALQPIVPEVMARSSCLGFSPGTVPVSCVVLWGIAHPFLYCVSWMEIAICIDFTYTQMPNVLHVPTLSVLNGITAYLSYHLISQGTAFVFSL